MTAVMVALGSAIGGLLRYWLTLASVAALGPHFPWGTIVINVTGSFAIGLLAALAGPDGRLVMGWDWRQFLMTGVCGGYTTFSAFSLQTLALVEQGHWGGAALNVVLSVVLCLAGVWLGHGAGEALSR